MAKKFPEIKEKNEGKFTAWVEKNMGGMDTCKAASKVMRSRTKKYSPAVVKMANYANNFGCKTKKDDGASVPLKGKQKNLPDALKSKILASDGASIEGDKPKRTVTKSERASYGSSGGRRDIKKKTVTKKDGTVREKIKIDGTTRKGTKYKEKRKLIDNKVVKNTKKFKSGENKGVKIKEKIKYNPGSEVGNIVKSKVTGKNK